MPNFDLTVRPSVRADSTALAQRLRASDVEEVEALNGLPAAQELHNSFDQSVECWTVLNHGVQVAMFGVSQPDSTPKNEGMIWMLAANIADTDEAILALGKISRQWYRAIAHKHDRLFNYVDVKNTRTIRWLKWLGFRMVKLKIGFATGKTYWEFDNTKGNQ